MKNINVSIGKMIRMHLHVLFIAKRNFHDKYITLGLKLMGPVSLFDAYFFFIQF